MPGTTDLPLLGENEQPPAIMRTEEERAEVRAMVRAGHVQPIKVSVNLGREQMYEFGRKGPYQRYVNYPVELSIPIQVLPTASG